MRKKNGLSRPVYAVLCAVTVLALAGCGKKEAEAPAAPEVKTETQTQTAPAEEKKEITLFVEEPENSSLRDDEITDADVAVDASVAGGVTLLTSDVNVRKLPTLASECAGMLPAGTWTAVDGRTEDNGWYLIDFEGEKGYIRADLVPEIVAASAAAEGFSPMENASGFQGLDPEKIPKLFWDYVNK